MVFSKQITAVAAALAITAISATDAMAATIRTGFDSVTFAANDDGSVGPVALGFTVDFFGVSSSTAFVNNNGNITFDSDLTTYTPFDLTSTGQQIIAPFFADVDTSNGGSPVTYGTGLVDGRNAFGVNWIDVAGFGLASTLLNDFQLVLIDRSDTGAGNFDIEFNYGNIQWDTGDASGGASARAGFSNGSGNAGTFFELAGSSVNGAFLDGGSNELISGTNIGTPGRFLFSARNSTIEVEPTSPVPLPAAAWMLLAGLGGLGALSRRRRG
jgi:hypothetical protein